MAIRTIRTEGDEILRKKSKKVEVIDEKIKESTESLKISLNNNFEVKEIEDVNILLEYEKEYTKFLEEEKNERSK